MAEEEKIDLIETVDEDGNKISFQLFDVIEFNGQEYALLLPVDDVDEEDPELVIMRLIAEGEDYSFETIEDDEEFNAVSAYIDELSEEVLEDL